MRAPFVSSMLKAGCRATCVLFLCCCISMSQDQRQITTFPAIQYSCKYLLRDHIMHALVGLVSCCSHSLHDHGLLIAFKLKHMDVSSAGSVLPGALRVCLRADALQCDSHLPGSSSVVLHSQPCLQAGKQNARPEASLDLEIRVRSRPEHCY